MNEYFVDTNIILRFVVKDDLGMFNASEKFFTLVKNGQKTALISVLVVQEVVWVLSHYYKLNRHELAECLVELFSIEGMKFFDIKKDELLEIIKYYERTNLDFVDIYLHLKAKSTNGQLYSFDEKLMQMGNNFLPTA